MKHSSIFHSNYLGILFFVFFFKQCLEICMAQPLQASELPFLWRVLDLEFLSCDGLLFSTPSLHLPYDR
jgi:hypothetical protein